MEREIIDLVKNEGPLTGSEILERLNQDPLLLWQACRRAEGLKVRTVGRRYLRLDRRVEGFARLSPSILREFMTYSVVGRPGNEQALAQRANDVRRHMEEVTRAKSELAYTIVAAIANRTGREDLIRRGACFIIAGDIVHNMAHDVSRPERSTGRWVRGSDMDIVVIVDDHFPRWLAERLDGMIYREKQDILMAPHMREEIDYVVKEMDRVREQMEFRNFRHMLACKILQEGTLLYGSEALFSSVKAMLRDRGVTEKLRNLEKRAVDFRRDAERALLEANPLEIGERYQNLFYPSEESEEFE